MKYFFLLLYALAIVRCNPYCPQKCNCLGGQQMRCSGLSAPEVDQLMISLSTNYWNGLKELAIWHSPSLKLENIPSIEKLEVLDISYNQLNTTWPASGTRFNFVRKLVVEHNKLSDFSKTFLYPFPSVEEVYIGFNNFTELGAEYIRMPRMRIIHANDNNIKQLPFYTLRFMPFLSDVDFSGNQISYFASSAIALVGSLRYLNLSRNIIASVSCDTAQPLPALEVLDLSQNKIENMPTTELKDFTGLRLLNISGNPIELAGDRYISLESLKVLDLSNTNLKVIESGAFSSLSDLHTLHLNNNPNLIFLSPGALENKTLFSLDLTNTGVKYISPKILHQVAQVKLSQVSLDCGCFLEEMSEIGTTTIHDWDTATCKTKAGRTIRLGDLSRSSLGAGDECRPEAILPMKADVHAFTGQTVALYCSGNKDGDQIIWRTPSGDKVEGGKPQSSYVLPRVDFFTSTLFEPQVVPLPRKRTVASTEYFRIDVLLETDAGEYECTVKRGKSTVSRKINLIVLKPPIQLSVSKVGVSTMHVIWNQNLQIFAADRVSLTIESFSKEVDHHRTVQLQLDSMYLSYNLVNLLPNKNYTVCLRWRLTDDNTMIYSSCITQKTEKVRGFLDELSPEFIAISGTILAIIFLYVVISKIWRSFHIYTTAKKQSKLIQSVSGQSIMSQSISSETYENHQLEIISSRSMPSQRDQAGPLLNQAV